MRNIVMTFRCHSAIRDSLYIGVKKYIVSRQKTKENDAKV